jgi:hypothetical protein
MMDWLPAFSHGNAYFHQTLAGARRIDDFDTLIRQLRARRNRAVRSRARGCGPISNANIFIKAEFITGLLLLTPHGYSPWVMGWVINRRNGFIAGLAGQACKRRTAGAASPHFYYSSWCCRCLRFG